jgi:hypothetical protein
LPIAVGALTLHADAAGERSRRLCEHLHRGAASRDAHRRVGVAVVEVENAAGLDPIADQLRILRNG